MCGLPGAWQGATIQPVGGGPASVGAAFAPLRGVMLDRRTIPPWRTALLALPLALCFLVPGFIAPAAAQDGERRDVEDQEWIEAEPPAPTLAFADVDTRSTSDDRRDVWTIRDIQRQWSDAVRVDDPIALRTADRRLMQWLGDELAEDQFEVDAEVRELARADADGDPNRVRVERMELARARADLQGTRRMNERLEGLQLAHDEGRATAAHRQAKATLIAALVRVAEDEVRVSGEEERQDREAYLDSLRTRPADSRPT